MSRFEAIGPLSYGPATDLQRRAGAPEAYVADLSAIGPEALAGREDPLRPVVLLNPTPEKIAAIAGIGVDCQGAVWMPGKDGAPDLLRFVPTPEAEIAAGGPAEAEVETPEKGSASPSGAVSLGDDPFAPMRGLDLATVLDAELRRPLLMAGNAPVIDPIPKGVAGRHVILDPAIYSYHPRTYTWAHSKTPVVIRDQTATLSLQLYAEIYASPDPANKFVRITTFGTGFSPGRMKWNGVLERGLFQDRLTARLALSGQPSGTGLLMTAPKTQNNQATYTSSGSITVGIKGGKDGPEPSASATISASVSSTLSDFRVLEKSAGLTGDWAFEMQLCGDKSSGTYDVNDPRSIIDGWGTVWDAPNLATSTLFPACMAAWALPLSCQSRLGLTMTLSQRLIYAASNRWTGMASWCEVSKAFGFSIDLSAVNVATG